MKRLLLALIAFFAFSFGAFAAVNLNTATKEELDTVKGIGPVKAQAIVDYRKEHGPFKSVDELKNVRGFGEKTVAKMRSELTVNGPTTVREAPAKSGGDQTQEKAGSKMEGKAGRSEGGKAGKPGKAESAGAMKEEKGEAGKEEEAGKQAHKDKQDKKKAKKDKQDKKDKKDKQGKKDKKKGKQDKDAAQ